ncbi:MAG TPA: hypothetical protein VJ552_13770, partial [Sediminibacterium sp.]|nr:hypothetical protein [Sediminibacterium sp.]
HKIQLMDDLIRRRATGNQTMFCRKVSMSRSLLNNYLSEMKKLGFPIEYDRKRGSYFYTENGCLVKSLFEYQINEKDADKIKGGCSVFRSQETNVIYYS